MLPRRVLLVVVVCLMAVARAISACTTDDDAARSTGVNTNVDASVSVTEDLCPDVAPDAGAVCLLPEGTACAFGVCAPPVECTRGTWQYGGNTSSLPCPDSPPTSGSACPSCWPSTQTCPYGSDDCSQPDASVNRTIASCPNGVWALQFYPCADASTDVQGDGAPDHG